MGLVVTAVVLISLPCVTVALIHLFIIKMLHNASLIIQWEMIIDFLDLDFFLKLSEVFFFSFNF